MKKCQPAAVRTLISQRAGSLPHSHFFLLLPISVHCLWGGTQRGKMLTLSLAIVWTRGGGAVVGGRWGGSLRVDAMHSNDISTCGWRSALCAFQNTDSLRRAAETLRCNLLHNGLKCLSFHFPLLLIEELSPACEQTCSLIAS